MVSFGCWWVARSRDEEERCSRSALGSPFTFVIYWPSDLTNPSSPWASVFHHQPEITVLVWWAAARRAQLPSVRHAGYVRSGLVSSGFCLSSRAWFTVPLEWVCDCKTPPWWCQSSPLGGRGLVWPVSRSSVEQSRAVGNSAVLALCVFALRKLEGHPRWAGAVVCLALLFEKWLQCDGPQWGCLFTSSPAPDYLALLHRCSLETCFLDWL